MSPLNRKQCLFLLLAVLVSHASLALHVNSHVALEQQTCDLCTHYSGFEHAPPPAMPEAFPLAIATPEPVRTVESLPAAESPHFRQRAPPLSA